MAHAARLKYLIANADVVAEIKRLRKVSLQEWVYW